MLPHGYFNESTTNNTKLERAAGPGSDLKVIFLHWRNGLSASTFDNPFVQDLNRDYRGAQLDCLSTIDNNTTTLISFCDTNVI